MIKKIVTGMLLVSTLALNAFAYDVNKAKEFDKFYSNFTQQACAKSKLYIDGEETIKMMHEKKKFTFLDIRTQGELAVVGLKSPNTLEIPVEHLFEEKNLNKLPKDELLIVVCYSGTRAVMAVASLKMIGFTNTRVMKGGIVGLAKGNSVKNAPLK
jgi:rhodanese-related sulfurtransferase